MRHRRVVICRSKEEGEKAIGGEGEGVVISEEEPMSDRPVVFMFPGQGSQHVNMALALYKDEPSFREQVDYCSEIITPHLGFDLRTVLYPRADQIEMSAFRLDQTWVTQPALFVTEYALAQLWMSWGIRPQSMIGHSIGEYVAACLAGVFSLEDALALVSSRGRLIHELPGGCMLAVALPARELRPLLGTDLDLAAVNGPTQSVLSGPLEAVNEFEKYMAQIGVICRRLHTSHAFHSHLLDSILEPFEHRVRQVDLRPPQISYISNVTGTWMTAEDAQDPSYWARQLRCTVRFNDGISELLKDETRVLLEVGPGQALSKLTRRHPQCARARAVFASLPDKKNAEPDTAFSIQTLSRLWLAGVQVEWAGFYSRERRRRVALPAYPFERERYWIEARTSTASVEGEQELKAKKADVGEWFYLPSWKRTARVKSRQEAEDGTWLIFEDETGIGRRVIDRLRAEGKQVIGVNQGTRFEKENREVYRINPASPGDYEALLRDLGETQRMPDKIMHLWSITGKGHAQIESGLPAGAEDTSFYSLIFLAQALGKERVTWPIQIEVVSNNVLSITSEEQSFPEKAAVLGPCKVIPQEYPGITCQFIDVVVCESDATRQNNLAGQLLAEFETITAETVVAYRGNQRWVQVFEQIRLESDLGEINRLRENGVYLITGGLSGIGFELAKYLAEYAGARLILVEALTLPQQGQWEEWLVAHSDQNYISRSIRKLKRLQATGAELLLINADFSSAEDMRGAVTRGCARFGEIHGVIHAAGVDGKSSFRAVQEINATECKSVLKSRIEGLLALEKALEGKELDFCVLASSLSSVLGGLGSMNYASANILMDAFASNHNKKRATLWVSINWDAWRFEEGEEQITDISDDLAQLAMTPQEGAEAFRRILLMEATDQVIVSTSDLPTRVNQWIHTRRSRRSKISEGVGTPLHARPPLESLYVSPNSEVERSIADIWQKALGIEPVGMNDNFFDLGGDSLAAIQVASQLKNELGIEVPVVSLYETLTISSLVALLDANENGIRPDHQINPQSGERKAKIGRRRDYQQKQRSRRSERKG